MENAVQRIREPELKEITIAYESNLNRMDELTMELRSKIRTIYNPPQLEVAGKSMDNNSEKKIVQDDVVSELIEKNKRLEVYNCRIEDMLQLLSRII